MAPLFTTTQKDRNENSSAFPLVISFQLLRLIMTSIYFDVTDFARQEIFQT